MRDSRATSGDLDLSARPAPGRSRRLRVARRLVPLVAVVSLVGLIPFGGGTERTVPRSIRTYENGWRGRTLTVGSDNARSTQAVTQVGAELRVRPTGTGVYDHNFRQAIIRSGAELGVDQEACVTWKGPADRLAQPGVVLRVASLSGGHTRAIMVTGNIWLGYRAGVNVHLVDTRNAARLTQVGQLDSVWVGAWKDRQPLPWRYCARVTGTELRWKAWALNQPEPSWDGGVRDVGRTTLPTNWVYAGVPGIYAGHLSPGETAVYTDWDLRRLRGTPTDARWTALRSWCAEAGRFARTGDRGTGGVNATAHDAARLATVSGSAAMTNRLMTPAVAEQADALHIWSRLLGRTDVTTLGGQTTDALVRRLATSSTFVGPLGERRYISRVHERILGRVPSAAEIDRWVPVLRSRGRGEVAIRVWRSDEHKRLMVRDAYRGLVGRDPSDAETRHVLALLAFGGGSDVSDVRGWVIWSTPPPALV